MENYDGLLITHYNELKKLKQIRDTYNIDSKKYKKTNERISYLEKKNYYRFH